MKFTLIQKIQSIQNINVLVESHNFDQLILYATEKETKAYDSIAIEFGIEKITTKEGTGFPPLIKHKYKNCDIILIKKRSTGYFADLSELLKLGIIDTDVVIINGNKCLLGDNYTKNVEILFNKDPAIACVVSDYNNKFYKVCLNLGDIYKLDEEQSFVFLINPIKKFNITLDHNFLLNLSKMGLIYHTADSLYDRY